MGLITQTLELPDYVTYDFDDDNHGRPVVHLPVQPDSFSPNAFYIVNDKVDFGSDAIVDGIAVVSLEEIVVGSNSTVTNSFLGSMGKIVLGCS